jgi:Kef-type K+ transport system membrane component KefB
MPEDISFTGIAIVAAAAFVSPFVLGLFPKLRLPSVVLEIVLGIVIGPSLLGWVQLDVTVEVLAVVGLGFLLFVSGLEVELDRLRGRALRLPLGGYVIGLGIALAVGFGLSGAGLVESPLLIAIALTATSLGLIVPVLKDSGNADTEFGQFVIVGGTIADFSTVILLTLFFSGESSGAGGTLLLLGLFVGLVIVVGLTLGGVGRLPRVMGELMRLQDTTAQIRIRGAIVLLMVFLVLATRFGLEAILGAFLAGAMLGRLDRDATMGHPHFRMKLEGIAYGFVVPIFFVTSGVRFDLPALFADAGSLVLVPVFLAALLLARGLPAILYRPSVGTRRSVAAGLMQATALPLVVTTAMIGLSLGLLDAATASALIAAGLLSVLLFPVLALTILQRAALVESSMVEVGEPEVPTASSAVDPVELTSSTVGEGDGRNSRT